MRKIIVLLTLLGISGTLSLSCGGDEKPAPKEIGMDTLTAAEKTADFSLFPAENKVEGSNEFLEKSFLEIPALDFVYTVDYDIDGDVFKLFLTRDYSGVKYINFRAAAGSETELRPYPEEILFDEDYGFMYDHPEYGTVIVGLKNNRLVGIMGFDDDARVSLFADWVATFPKPETPVTESKENK